MARIASRLRSRQMAWALVAVGAIGLMLSAVLYFLQPKPTAKASSVSVATAPSAKRPSRQAVAAYVVPPTSPKYLNIPKLGIHDTRIMPLGQRANGQIVTPNNLFDAGWYKASSKPGQPGAMFVFGHVSSWQSSGLFQQLDKLRRGDQVTITRGDNTQYTYVVQASKVYAYDQVDMTQVLAPIDASAPGLNLMTCTGQVIKGTSEFNERLVVFASLKR